MKTCLLGGALHLPERLVFFLFLLVSWSISTNCIAQEEGSEVDETSPVSIQYGVKAGITSSGFYEFPTKDRDHTGHVTGVVAGGFVNYPINEMLTASAELLYMQQGGTRVEIKEALLGGNTLLTGNVVLHNLEVPVLIRAGMPGLIPGFKPELIVGPSFGFNLAARQSQDYTYFIEDLPITTDGSEGVRSEFQSIQLGVHLGLGSEVQVGDHFMYFDARYRFGVTPINNGFDAFDLLRDATDIVSNSFVFSLGFTL